jgi:Suppressor of fused protein (SUFU)
MTPHCEAIASHYKKAWKNGSWTERHWREGPFLELPAQFCVLEFPPTEEQRLWTYATCGMSQPGDDSLLELHLFSPTQTDAHVELLTVVAHFHRTRASLGPGHTINFGRPWFANSKCDHGLISLPYLDGPSLEQCGKVRCLWLIPITRAEREFKVKRGLESLEAMFEFVNFKYADPLRHSVIKEDESH